MIEDLTKTSALIVRHCTTQQHTRSYLLAYNYSISCRCIICYSLLYDTSINTTQHYTVLHYTIRHDTIQYNTTRHALCQPHPVEVQFYHMKGCLSFTQSNHSFYSNSNHIRNSFRRNSKSPVLVSINQSNRIRLKEYPRSSSL